MWHFMMIGVSAAVQYLLRHDTDDTGMIVVVLKHIGTAVVREIFKMTRDGHVIFCHKLGHSGSNKEDSECVCVRETVIDG